MLNDFTNAYKDFEIGKANFPEKSKLFDDEIEKTKQREAELNQNVAPNEEAKAESSS